MKTLAKVLLVVSCVLAFLAMFSVVQEAKADTFSRDNDDGTFTVTCVNDSVDLVVAECKQTFLKICPEGGKVLDAQGSPLDQHPLTLIATIKCNPSKVI